MYKIVIKIKQTNKQTNQRGNIGAVLTQLNGLSIRKRSASTNKIRRPEQSGLSKYQYAVLKYFSLPFSVKSSKVMSRTRQPMFSEYLLSLLFFGILLLLLWPLLIMMIIWRRIFITVRIITSGSSILLSVRLFLPLRLIRLRIGRRIAVSIIFHWRNICFLFVRLLNIRR